MRVHTKRNEYTTSPIWPVVPFRLTEMSDVEQNKLGVDYTIGLDPGIVRGWSMMIAEDVGHAVLIYDRPLPGEDLQGKLETIRFYEVLAPICNKLRECTNGRDVSCLQICNTQDKTVVCALFKKINELYEEGKEFNQLKDFDANINNKSTITIA